MHNVCSLAKLCLGQSMCTCTDVQCMFSCQTVPWSEYVYMYRCTMYVFLPNCALVRVCVHVLMYNVCSLAKLCLGQRMCTCPDVQCMFSCQTVPWSEYVYMHWCTMFVLLPNCALVRECVHVLMYNVCSLAKLCLGQSMCTCTDVQCMFSCQTVPWSEYVYMH